MTEPVKKVNAWILHCKAYQKEHGCSYKEAISLAKDTYKKSVPAPTPVKSEEKDNPELLDIKDVIVSPEDKKVEEATKKLANLTVRRNMKKKQ